MDRLVFVEGVQKGQRFPVDRASLDIGRDRNSDVPIDDAGASRHHAVLFRTEKGLRLRDLDSTNGTFVNSRRIEEVDLQNGDRIAIGDTVILMEIGALDSQPRVLVSEASHDTTTDITLPMDQSEFFSAAEPVAPGKLDAAQALFRLSTSIAGVLDMRKLAPLAARHLGDILGADRGAILLLEKNEELAPCATWPEDCDDVVISRTITDYVLEHRQAVLSTPRHGDPDLRKGVSIATRNVGSILCVPLLAEDRILGVIYLDTRMTSPAFGREHLRLLSVLGVELAFAIENARLYRSLRNAEEFASCILKSMNSGLLVLDTEGVILRTNEAAAEIFGLPMRDLVGLPAGAHPALRGVADLIEQTWQSGLPVDGAEVTAALEEREVPLLVNTSLLEDYAGQATGVVCSLRDMSRVKRLEEEVKRAQHLAALGEMAAGIAHEVRNPLNSVRGFAQLLGEEAANRGDGEGEGYGRIIVQEVDRINRIVQDLLDYSRQRELTMVELDLGGLLTSIASALRPEFEAARVRLALDLPEAPLRMLGSPDKLRQAFLNLLRNALQACEAEGRVDVALERTEEEQNVYPLAAVSIRDNGGGIPPETLSRIFNPFFTTRDTGTGLGLAITEKIVEQHAGHVRVLSSPGLGSTFTVTLPLLEKSGA